VVDAKAALDRRQGRRTPGIRCTRRERQGIPRGVSVIANCSQRSNPHSCIAPRNLFALATAVFREIAYGKSPIARPSTCQARHAP
jgi:hypothetical protein